MATLNRFPLWGLFASRAALRIGYSESEARLLGYSTALLYAILRNHGGGGKKKKIGVAGATVTVKPATPAFATDTISFAGMDFQCNRIDGSIVQTVVGGELQTADRFHGQVEDKFRTLGYIKGGTMLSALCEAFDAFLANYTPEELQGSSLYALYATWRDACKSGFNLVDLNVLMDWLREHTHAACAA
jgi:hypothetical protein